MHWCWVLIRFFHNKFIPKFIREKRKYFFLNKDNLTIATILKKHNVTIFIYHIDIIFHIIHQFVFFVFAECMTENYFSEVYTLA